MQHPFAGLVETEQKSGVVDPAVSTPTRRGLFGLIAGTLAVGTLGTVGLLGSSNEAEARVTTQAWGEEGGTRRSSNRSWWGGRRDGYRHRSTSIWWNEEGGYRRRSTSIWWGEEGGYRHRRHLKK
jgi:hypothetical protein